MGVKKLAHGHTANQWWGQELKLALSDQPVALTTTVHLHTSHSPSTGRKGCLVHLYTLRQPKAWQKLLSDKT